MWISLGPHHPKNLGRLLGGSEAEDAVPLILAAGDECMHEHELRLKEIEKRGVTGPTTNTSVHPEKRSCSICYEDYDENNVVPRILITCGHSFCERCISCMLRPLQASGGEKLMECPKCRKECPVRGGRATALPVKFEVIGA